MAKPTDDIVYEQRAFLPNRRKSVDELLGDLRSKGLKTVTPPPGVEAVASDSTIELTQSGKETEVSSSLLMKTVDDAFNVTRAIAETKAAEYKTALARLRWISMLYRAGALAALVVGLSAPLLETLLQQPNASNIGYAAMIVGGALVLADRVFVATSRWARLLEAQVCLEDLTMAFQYEWQRRRLWWSAGTLTPSRANEELVYLQKVVDEIMEQVKVEAKESAAELREGVSLLGRHLSLEEAAAAARKRVAERVSKTLGTTGSDGLGHVQVEVDFAGAPEDARVEVSVGTAGDPEREREVRVIDSTMPVTLFTLPMGTLEVTVSSEKFSRPFADFVPVGSEIVTKKYKPTWSK
jgi:hypothetical protein